MGAKNIVVYTMPKMKKYLEKNGPWNQLINLKNIVLLPMNDKKEIQLSRDLILEPFLVPHRDEYSETVGFNIIGPNESMLYIPDGERKVKITISFNGTRFNQLLRTESQEFGLEEEHNMVHFVSRALEAFFTEDFLTLFRYQH